MNHTIRGIRCVLDSYWNRIGDLICALAAEDHTYYIPWCLLLDHNIFPHVPDVPVSIRQLQELATDTIWELELRIYPFGETEQPFEDYSGFLNSRCQCVLLYYDCGCTELYLKNTGDAEALWDKLVSLGAEELVLITDENDGRVHLHL